MRIELHDVSLAYDGIVALGGLTASVQGRVVGLLGANGSGKTSLLQILAGLKPPTSSRPTSLKM